jgi:hypothetical protein
MLTHSLEMVAKNADTNCRARRERERKKERERERERVRRGGEREVKKSRKQGGNIHYKHNKYLC